MDDKNLFSQLDEPVPLTREEDLTDEDKKLVKELESVEIKRAPSVENLNAYKNKLLADKARLSKRRAKAKRAKASRKRNRR